MEKLEFNLQGKIIDQNNRGKENLIVISYDTDIKLNLPKDHKQNIIKFLEKEGSERLGSTYSKDSKDDGSFEFIYEYKDFAPQKEEKRPDVVVVILAPEEKDKELTERVLYYSDYTIHNGGQSEALLIKLKGANIVSSEVDSRPMPATLYSYLNFKKEENEKFSNNIVPLLIDSYNKKKKLQENSMLKNTYLTTLPKSILNSDHFIKDKNDKSTLSKKMDMVIKNSFPKFSVLALKSPTYIALTKEDWETAQIDTNPFDNNDTIEIPYNKYCGLVSEKTKGKQLIKKIL